VVVVEDEEVEFGGEKMKLEGDPRLISDRAGDPVTKGLYPVEGIIPPEAR